MSVLKDTLRRLKNVLRTKPLRFQVEGIVFLEENNGRALLGDDMGVGKTLQVLGWLALHSDAGQTLIVCPSNAKYEWEDQIQQHTKYLECEVLAGIKPYETNAPILVINFDILPYWEAHLIKMGIRVLVIDECHYIKSRNIKRTKTCKKLSKKAKHIIPMSGTAIINRPVEFFPVLNILRPGEFRSFWKYAFRYCRPKKGFQGKGWIFTGATNTAELHKRVSPFMIRRMKEDVLKDLPAKRRITLRIDIDNMSEYEACQTNFKSWYGKTYGKKKWSKAEKMEQYVKLGQLRQIAARGKYNAAVNWIEDFLTTTDEKLVIFCYHRVVFDQLVKKYKSIAAIGGKSGRKRKMMVRRFQKHPKCRLYIGSIKSDREAITLTAASTVLFIELGWTPGEHDQAEDRVNRIGQTSSSISAYYLIGRDTIDEFIWGTIERKRRIVAKVLDGEEVDYEQERRDSIRQIFSKMKE